MNYKYSNLPLFIVNGFIIFTLFIFFLGPINWYISLNDILRLILFMFFIIIFIFFGFILGKRINNYKVNDPISLIFKKINLNLVFLSSFLILFPLVLINLINKLYVDDLSLVLIIQKLYLVIFSPQLGYWDREGIQIGGKIFTYFYVLMSPLLLSYFIFGYYDFTKLSLFNKFSFILFVMIELLSWVAIGTNKGIFDQFFIIFTIFLVKFIRNEIKLNLRRRILLMLSIAAVILILFLVFYLFIGGRLSFSPIIRSDFFSINTFFLTNGLVENDFYKLYIYFSNYISQGYFGLIRSFDSESPFYFGFGGSSFLIYNIQELFGINLTSNLLQFKTFLNSGWPALEKWHTVYVYLANEVGFFLTPLYIMFYGFLFGHSLRKSLMNPHSFDLVLLFLIMIFFFYSSANNQIMQYSHTAFTLIFILVQKITRKFYEIIKS